MWKWGLFILTLCLGTLPGAVLAQVSMTVDLGFQRTVRLERWNPVVVHLFNTSAPLTGTLGIRVWRGSEFRKDLHVTTFTQSVTLPHRSRKRYTFAIPITSIAHPIEVTLRQGDAVVAEQHLDLRDAFSAEHVILGLTRDLSLDFLATTFQRHTRVAYVSPAELPQHWSGYDSVTAVVVKGVSLQSLTDAQATALRQWLARGGTMIVAGDSQYALLQEPRLRAILPVEVFGIEPRDGLPVLVDHYGVPMPVVPLLAVSSRLQHGQVIVGTAEMPLLAERGVGKGRVVFLAVDYAVQPLSGWQGNKALWHDMLRPVEHIDFGRVFAELGLLDEAHPIIKLLRRPILVYPSHMLLSVFLLAYCSVLGVLFWRLGKRRTKYAPYWIALLLTVLAATGGAYRLFPEHGLRGSALLLDVGTAEVLPGTEYSHTHGYLGVFSTRGGEYTLQFQHPTTILRHTFHRGAGKAGEAMEVAATEPFAVRGLALEAWALRVLSVESVIPTPLHVEAKRHGVGLTVQAKNRGALPIQGTSILYKGRVFPLGTLAPDEEIFEDLYVTLQPLESKQETIWQTLFKIRPTGSDPRLSYLQEVLLQHYFGEKRLTDPSEVPFLVGWVMAPSSLMPDSEAGTTRALTLVVSRLLP
jgi:hypothetical protein